MYGKVQDQQVDSRKTTKKHKKREGNCRISQNDKGTNTDNGVYNKKMSSKLENNKERKGRVLVSW